MKKRNMWLNVGLAILMVGLLMTVSSCMKKKPRVEPMENYPSQTQMGTETGAQGTGSATPALTEEELKAQRLQEQKAMQMKEEAGKNFTNEDIHFNFDDATLNAEARMILTQKIEWLRENPGAKVLIEGNCDERGTEEYNIALGQRRAESVKTFLVNAGISADRLSTISYGEERPVDFGNNEAAWAKNRRVHFDIQN